VDQAFAVDPAICRAENDGVINQAVWFIQQRAE
jgi:hypothetical protein